MKKTLFVRIVSLVVGCLLTGGGVSLFGGGALPKTGVVSKGEPLDFQYDPAPYERDEEPPAEETLPSGTVAYRPGNRDAGYVEGECLQSLSDGKTSSPVKAVANLGYRFSMWSDGVTDPVREGDPPGQTIYALFDYIGLPELYLDFEEEALTKTDYIPGSISAVNLPERYRLLDEPLRLRGRGNASFGFDKKSFKLKFGEKLSLLGLGEAAKTWVLISNHTDKSLLRNYFTYVLQQRMPEIGYSFPCTMASVYVNGEYRGVYLVCPQIEAGEGRVPISDVGGQDDIGFLLELDHYYSGEEGKDYVIVNDIPFSVKSSLRTEGQSRYLVDYLTRCDRAIRSGVREDIEAVVDLPSFLDAYVLEEFVKNIDVGWSSFYMFIPEGGGKLTFGPCWDFDLSAGNDYRIDGGDYQGLYVGERRDVRQENLWYSLLMEFDWFRRMAAERYFELLPVIRQTIVDVEKFAYLNYAGLEANFDVWQIFDQQISKEPLDVLQRKTYEEQLKYLFDWYKSRLDWLEDCYGEILYGTSDGAASGDPSSGDSSDLRTLCPQ